MEIIPAILRRSFVDIEQELSDVVGVAPIVQIDFCDGVFVPSKTWPYGGQDVDLYEKIVNEKMGMPYWEDIEFEFDLMISDPASKLEEIVKLGPKRIIFHLASLVNPVEFFQNIDLYIKENIELGVAVTIHDDIKKLEPIIDEVKFIQCMGIAEVGVQGSAFDEKAIDLVHQINEIYPDKIISVDGAVNEENILSLRDAGATRFCIGSAIFNNDNPRAQYREFFGIIKS